MGNYRAKGEDLERIDSKVEKIIRSCAPSFTYNDSLPAPSYVVSIFIFSGCIIIKSLAATKFYHPSLRSLTVRTEIMCKMYCSWCVAVCSSGCKFPSPPPLLFHSTFSGNTTKRKSNFKTVMICR
jgi:hypothetical protein